MPVATSYPGIYIEEVPNNARTISAAPTSITVFLGYTHPFKTKNFRKPVRIFSIADYEREFGGVFCSDNIPNHVPYAVQQFFLNGGSDAYVYGLEPTIGGTAFPKAEASLGLGTLKLRAKEPVNGTDFAMTVTLSNVKNPPDAPVASADVTIAFGSQVEVYRGVNFTSASTVSAALASSTLVEVSGAVSGTVAAVGPTQFAYTAPIVTNAYTVSDFTLAFASGGTLDKVEIFNLLVIPGIAANPILSPAVVFCEQKRAFLLVDVPDNQSVDTIVGNANSLVDLPTSPNAAFYFPHLESANPRGNAPLRFPPSGTMAGIFARTDTNRGVWKAPAGLETTLRNVTGVVPEGVMNDSQAGVLNEERAVNAIRTFSGIGTVSFGARTSIAENVAFQQWKYVPVRRMALFIEQTLLRNLGWAIFEPNDVPLWTALRTSIEAFMLSLFRQGAFQGSKPSEAFFVQCDSTTTTQTDIDNGRVIIAVGFRPLKPAEFVIVKISQLAGQVQA